MQSRYAQVILPTLAVALLLLARAGPAEPVSIAGEPLYTIRYWWINQQFTLVDTVDSDTTWVTQSADTYTVQMRFFRLDLPTPPGECLGWGVQAWTSSFGPDETTGVLMQVFPQDQGDTSFSYPEPFWGQWGTYHACPPGQLSSHRSPEASDSHNAWLLNEERPAAVAIILGVRTYPWQVHCIDRVELLWDTGTDAAHPPPGLPQAFNVAPCYPNPFNAAVTVPFSLATPGEVSVSVYNILGERVATLVSGQLAAGSHEARWMPQGIGSGTFLVQVSAAGQTAVQRLTYIR